MNSLVIVACVALMAHSLAAESSYSADVTDKEKRGAPEPAGVTYSKTATVSQAPQPGLAYPNQQVALQYLRGNVAPVQAILSPAPAGYAQAAYAPAAYAPAAYAPAAYAPAAYAPAAFSPAAYSPAGYAHAPVAAGYAPAPVAAGYAPAAAGYAPAPGHQIAIPFGAYQQLGAPHPAYAPLQFAPGNQIFLGAPGLAYAAGPQYTQSVSAVPVAKAVTPVATVTAAPSLKASNYVSSSPNQASRDIGLSYAYRQRYQG